MKKNIFLLICILNTALSLNAQNTLDTLTVNIDDVILRAAKQSVDAMVAQNEYLASYWEYKTYRSELLPEIIFKGTLPYYSKSYNQYQQSDGTYTFVANDYSKIDAGLSIKQNLPLTGGTFSVESSMEQLKQYGDNSATNWKTVPMSVTFQQPILGFNSLAWQKKIMPIKKTESEKKLIANIEEVSNTAIMHYFNLLTGKSNLDIAQQNKENMQRLYTIAQAKYKIGQLSENDLLQLHVSVLNTESSVVNAQASYDSRLFQLSSFLGYEGTIIIPEPPSLFSEHIPQLIFEDVLYWANQNNAITQSVQRQMLEASRDVSQAKADRWDISLFASFGKIGQSNTFSNTFKSDYLKNNQIVEVGVSIPLLDWGKRKGKVKIAESNRKVAESKLQKDLRDFRQELFLTVQNFNNQPKLLNVAKEKDEIAQKRYEICIDAFVLGKMDVLNLNDSQSARDTARQSYIEQLYYLWSYYYQIRSLTLYDFVNNEAISIDYRAMLGE